MTLKELSPGERVLLEEACRLADRLDQLNRLLSGDLDCWLSIAWPYEDSPAEVVVNQVMTEARQGAAELRQIVKQLAMPSAPEVPAVVAPAGVTSILSCSSGKVAGGKR